MACSKIRLAFSQKRNRRANDQIGMVLFICLIAIVIFSNRVALAQEDNKQTGISKAKDFQASALPNQTEQEKGKTDPQQQEQEELKKETRFALLSVHRRPAMSTGEIHFTQDLQYWIALQIDIEPKLNEKTQKVAKYVSQKVVDAGLNAADEISAATFTESLKNLIGKEMTYQAGHYGQIEEFKTNTDNHSINPLKALGGEGLMVSNVLDQDGWRELSRLIMFQPEETSQEWTEEIKHDWKSLGSWAGNTTFKRLKSEKKEVQRFGYEHHLQYSAPEKSEIATGLTASDMTFSLRQFGGQIWYDVKKKRASQVSEDFAVSGKLQTTLLGVTAEIQTGETQHFELRIFDQDEWQQSRNQSSRKGSPRTKSRNRK